MCLVKSSIFKSHYSTPLVAGGDIVVYKTLDYRNPFTGEKVIRTPYRFHPISFKDGKCVMDGYLECNLEKSVSFGFHSYVDEKKANMSCERFPETEMTKHWAIIPKGGRYFLGNDGDIVSDKLIIFETKEDFMEYRKNQIKRENLTIKELESYIKEKITEAKKELGDDANVLEICMYIYSVGLDDGAAGVKIK